MTELVLDQSLHARSRTASGWIVSPTYDLLLIIFAPLVILPVIGGYLFGSRILAVGLGLTLAFAHYYSSITFYFWDENKTYHRERWIAFFAGPVVLAAVYGLLLYLRVPYIIQLALFFWNAYHVARQNCGILSVYRHRAGIHDVHQRDAANRAILSVGIFLSLWNIETFREIFGLLNAIPPQTVSFIRFAAGAVAVIALADLVRALWKRYRAGELPGLPEGLFLLSSLAFFFPYLIVRSSEMATVALLLPHYVQYMALVWLVHRRKFGSGQTAGAPPLLRAASSSLLYLIPSLVVIGGVFYLLHEWLMKNGYPAYVFENLYLLIAFEHYYLDGLIWSFKRSHVRKTIAPALLGQPTAS